MPYSLPTWTDNATPVNAANLGLINTAINALAQSGQFEPTAVGGTGNAITVTMSPVPVVPTDCPVILFKAVASNTGAATISPNGLGPYALTKQGNVALASGNINTGDTIMAVYDPTSGQYVGINIGVGSGGGGGGVSGGPVSGYGHISNLTVKNNAVTPHTKLDVTFDSIILANSSDVLIEEIGGTAGTVDLGVVGVNGLDAGAIAASTWYYVYVISNGTVTNLLVSTSATAPTMPGGYGYKRLISAWRTDGSANLLPAYQFNERLWYPLMRNVLTGGGATSYTSVSLAGYVPPSAVESFLHVSAVNSVTNNFAQTVDFSADGTNAFAYSYHYNLNGADLYANTQSFRMPMLTAQTMWYKGQFTPSVNVDVQGFILNL